MFYLDLHPLLQQSLGLVLHLQPGSTDEQQVIFYHFNPTQVHTLWQVVWKDENMNNFYYVDADLWL